MQDISVLNHCTPKMTPTLPGFSIKKSVTITADCNINDIYLQIPDYVM